MTKRGRPKGDTKIHAAARKHKRQESVNGVPPLPCGGKTAAEFETRTVEWLLHPWIPRALLSMVVGNPCVGKSSFIAALLAHATGGRSMEDFVRNRHGKAVFLPGYEEDLEVMTVPRLRAAGVRLERVLMLTDDRISLAKDKEQLARTVKAFGASMLVGDPIDSYIDEEFSENDSQAVRPLLEAAAWIARETGAAVVFARHPGKDKDNVMPGSRAWRAVPRSIVQLTTDGSIPPRYLLSHFKDSLGTKSQAREYSLDQEPGEPPTFEMGEDVDRVAEDLLRSAQAPTGRYKLMLACRLVRYCFEEEKEPTRVKLGEEARRQGLGEDTLADALRLLGVKSIPPGKRGDPWILKRTSVFWPKWLPQESGGVSPPETPGDVESPGKTQ